MLGCKIFREPAYGPMFLWMSNEPEQNRGFPQVAANVSLAMPVVAILVSGVWGANGGNKILIGLLCMLCIGAGVVLAAIALCNLGQNAGRGLLTRGVLGLLFNGIFVAIFGIGVVAGFTRGVKARQTERELVRTAESLRENTRTSLSVPSGTTNANTSNLKRLQDELKQDEERLEGDGALFAKTWGAYVREVERRSDKWQGLKNELAAAKALDFRGVKRQQELRDRQALVRRYKASSDEMRALVVNGSDFLDGELKKLGASPEATEKALNAFEVRNATQNRVLMEIRDLDTRMSNDMLGILSLMETNWGSWSCPDGPVVFKNEQLLREYNRCWEISGRQGRSRLRLSARLGWGGRIHSPAGAAVTGGLLR